MIWIIFSSVIIVLALCIFTVYKWIKAEKRVNELQEDKHGLQLDKLQLKREVSWLKNKDNNKQGTYVVEVNKDIFLKEMYIPNHIEIANHFDGIYFTFVGLEQASIFRSLSEAKVHAKKCGGKVLQHKPNLEVVE
ncbi:hypothetical protein IM146_04960 [Staphylococcus epidermidis]|uniref:hypothetical protein n=1 Tax=Staphylococcus epidermidis TaxID=1282 RepID=UPI00187E9A03|nr:hypothetical protein [Staphylococcus epidermidis]MBE9439732.1 hypothetical protein [Staphylococcus epidermidis]